MTFETLHLDEKEKTQKREIHSYTLFGESGRGTCKQFERIRVVRVKNFISQNLVSSSTHFFSRRKANCCGTQIEKITCGVVSLLSTVCDDKRDCLVEKNNQWEF